MSLEPEEMDVNFHQHASYPVKELIPVKWVGIDTHKKYVHVTEIYESGKKESYRCNLDEAGISTLKSRIGFDAHVVLEATFNTFRLYDELVPHVKKIMVAHPSQTRGATSFHLRNDKISSEILARLLASDFVREVWVPDREIRGLRSLAEYRWAVSNSRIGMMGRIHALLHNEIIQLPVNTLMSKKGRTCIEQIDWRNTHLTLERDSLLRLYDALHKEIECIDAALRTWSYRSEDARLLMTIPGIGAVSAALIMSQIGVIERFPNSRKLCAYAGIVPRVYSSGMTNRTGRITRSGRSIFRWVLGLAITNIIHRPCPLAEFHRALCLRRPKRVAHVAFVRKLLVIIWCMLHTRQPYRYEDKGLTARKLTTKEVSVNAKPAFANIDVPAPRGRQ